MEEGGPEQLFGIIDRVPDLACCFPTEDSNRSAGGGGICLRVDAPRAKDIGHAGDGQRPEGLFDTGEDTGTR